MALNESFIQLSVTQNFPGHGSNWPHPNPCISVSMDRMILREPNSDPVTSLFPPQWLLLFFFFPQMASYLLSLFPSHCRDTELPLSMEHPNHPPACKLFQEVHGCMLLESACNAGDPGLIPRSGRSLGEGNDNPLQYSCLENPVDRRVWRATVRGVTQSWTRLND